MKTILTYTCSCGEDLYEDDECCVNCGAAVDKTRFVQQEIAEITEETIRSHRIFLPASAVKPGHLVIINEWNRPCAQLLVYLHTVTPQKKAIGYYLSTHVQPAEASARIEKVTPVNTFGMTVQLGLGHTIGVFRDASLPYQARYQDGQMRAWQPRLPVLPEEAEVTRVKPHLWPLLLESALRDEKAGRSE